MTNRYTGLRAAEGGRSLVSPNWWTHAFFLATLLGAYTALIAYLSVALWIWTYPAFHARPDPGMGGPHVYAAIVSVVLGMVAAAVTFLAAGLLRRPHRQVDQLRMALQSVLVGAFTWIVSYLALVLWFWTVPFHWTASGGIGVNLHGAVIASIIGTVATGGTALAATLLRNSR